MKYEPLNQLHSLFLSWQQAPQSEEAMQAILSYLGTDGAGSDIWALAEAANSSLHRREPALGIWAIAPLLLLAETEILSADFAATTFGVFGSILMEMGRYADAEAAARKGLDLQEKNGAPTLVIAQSYGALGSILMRMGRYADAEAACRKGLDLEEKNGAPPLVIAESYGALGSILMVMGRYADAEAAARKGLDLQEKNGAPPLVIADSYGALGSILMHMGRYADAEAAARKGLDLREKNGAPPLVIAQSYGALGSILMQMGRYADAEAAARKGLDLQEKNGAPPLVIAQSYGALGSILMRMGRYADAEAACRKGLDLEEKNGAPPLVIADSYGALGSILMHMGRYADAEAAARKGLDLREKNGAPPLVISDSYGALGSILMHMGRYADAESEYGRCLKTALAFGGVGELPIKSAYWLACLAADPAVRAQRHQQAIDSLLDFALSLNAPEDHFNTVRRYSFVFDDAIAWALATNRDDLALEWVDRSRGLGFTLALAKQTANHEVSEHIERLGEELNTLNARLAASPSDEELRRRIEALSSEQRQIVTRERKRAEELAEAPLKRSDRQALIPEGALYLAIQPLGDLVLAYALTRDGEETL